MARKSNRSSSRRARQRRRQRGPLRPSIPQPAPRAEDATAATPVVEAAPERAARERPASASGQPRARSASRPGVAGPSRLSERAIAEYHYVQRDLRNIAVLVVIMAITLGAATVIVNLLGITQV